MSESAQIAVIGAIALVASGVVSAIIAYLGFRITLKTSTKANEEIAKITRFNHSELISFQSRSKLAEMRQAWIEDLRLRLATYSSLTSRQFLDLTRNGSTKGDDPQSAYAYILLKLNPKESNSQRLGAAMAAIGAIINEMIAHVDSDRDVGSPEFKSRFEKALLDFHEISSDILKTEWDRLKKEMSAVPATSI